ncbi:Hsp70 family protein [Williamsia sp.]|uniref:Hsp70 family protein n=1 Tax=Williamsia sp. TaxID=1872085 RepID=UPI002F91DBF3
MTADWLLGIDFGTSNTAAAHSGATSGVVETLALSHTSNVMSSAVFVDTPDRIAVGDVALNSAERNPASFIPSPKRLVGQQSVINVNGYSLPAYVLIGAVLRSVLGRAAAAHGGQPPAHLVLTHPEAWSPIQVQVLRDAAAQAGADPHRITTISEPRAAAQHYSRTHAVDPGARIAVFDFGGGTLDVAVLAATGHGTFDVIAARGDNGLGGKNFDALIRRWVDGQLESRNPPLLAYLRRAPVGIRQNLDDSIRRAKELLSEAPSATITVAGEGFHETLQITRDEFDELIDAPLDRAVHLTRAALADAGIAPGQLTALYLTGGTSRIPLVHQKLAPLGKIATLDDPKTVVAQGSLTALVASQQTATGPQYAQTQIRPSIPGAADLLPSSPTPAAPASGKRTKILAAVAAVVVVAAAAVLGIVLTSGGDETPGNAAAVSSTTSQPDQVPTTGTTLAVTEEEVLAGLPTQLTSDFAECKKNGFTENDGVELRCVLKDDGATVVGTTDDGVSMFVSLDLKEAKKDVLKKRQLYGQDEGDELVENTDRTAAADIDVQSGDYVYVTYANNVTGVRASIHGLDSAESAKTFLRRAGLVN